MMRELIVQAAAVAAGLRIRGRTLVLVGLVLGLALGVGGGLYIGWVVWPVNYAGEVSVSETLYVGLVADLFAYGLDIDRARRAMDWPGAAAATCRMMDGADDGRRVRLWMLLVVMGEDCP